MALGILLLITLTIRLFLLSSSQTELEADEAIVGLMARHILQGERPIFYWMQPYMGSLEAYLVAIVFSLFGASTQTMKLVPLTFTLIFTMLVFITGFRLGGLRTALASGLYIAVPPAFLAIWGLKARGGYIEVLVIGQLLILIAFEIVKKREINSTLGVAIGFLSGLGMWVNPLVGVYLVPIGVYLALMLGRRFVGRWMLFALISALLSASLLIAFNLNNGITTAGAMLSGNWSVAETPRTILRFFRYCLPILVGVSQASSSPTLFWPAFGNSLGSSHLVVSILTFSFILTLLRPSRTLFFLICGKCRGDDGRGLLALILIFLPMVFAVSKFRDLISEPRYLLPIYSTVPLFAAEITKLPVSRRTLAITIAAAAIAINIYSIATLDPRLNLPDSALGSTQSNRAELIHFLLSRGLDHIYTDYWIAYPLAFESSEQITPSVISGGYNRYIPYAYYVSVAPNPAFLFISGSKEEADFLAKVRENQVETKKDTVGIYSVYSQVNPIEKIRP